MRLLIVAVIACLAAPLAAAMTELERDFVALAGALEAETGTRLAGEPGVPDADYLDRIARFAAAAGQLAGRFDGDPDHADYACIYRGMAEEAARQGASLQGPPAAHGAALRRLHKLFDDAQAVAVARDAGPRDPAAGPLAEDAQPCTARPLAEQDGLDALADAR